MVRKIVLAAALIFLLCRFLFPGDIVFITDEPLFQLTVDQHQNAGTFPLVSFRGSKIPLAYGAGALYFYWPVRWFTANPIKIGLYHIFFVSLSALFLYLALRRRFGEEASAWALLACSASPLLFLFSRHPWDNTLLYTLSALVLYLFSRLEEVKVLDRSAYMLLAFLGLVVGYGINVHLMFGSIAVAASLSVLFSACRLDAPWTKKLTAITVFGLVCFLAVAPYFWEAYRLMQTENALEISTYKKRWGDSRNLWWTFQKTAIFSSLWGSKVYWQTLEPVFYNYVGSFWTYFFRVDLFGWFGKLAGWSLPFVCIWQFIRREKVSLLLFFLTASFFCLVLLYQYLNIPTDPHYFNPLWWFVFVGIASAITALSPLAKRFFLGTIVLTALVNVAFLFFSAKYVHENHGAKNMFYSTVVSEQLRVTKAICADMDAKQKNAATVDISKVFMNAYSFRFHFSHLPECHGKEFSVGSLEQADYKLHYPDHATDASLLF